VHRNIADKCGFKWSSYRYYKPSDKSLEITGLLEDLDKAEKESIVILHVCAHNPTGVDPKPEQWK
jgi:aspartate/tyrosine/aromatic aminotransferase